jgi:hypothetical protein
MSTVYCLDRLAEPGEAEIGKDVAAKRDRRQQKAIGIHGIDHRKLWCISIIVMVFLHHQFHVMTALALRYRLRAWV